MKIEPITDTVPADERLRGFSHGIKSRVPNRICCVAVARYSLFQSIVASEEAFDGGDVSPASPDESPMCVRSKSWIPELGRELITVKDQLVNTVKPIVCEDADLGKGGESVMGTSRPYDEHPHVAGGDYF